MPFYRYTCNDCDFDDKLFHGMKETIDCCPECGSKHITKAVNRFVSRTLDESKNISKTNVENFIRDSKKDLQDAKKSMRNRES